MYFEFPKLDAQNFESLMIDLRLRMKYVIGFGGSF